MKNIKVALVAATATILSVFCASSATNIITVLIVSPTLPDYVTPFGWRVEEQAGTNWTFSGTAIVSTSSPTNATGGLRLTNVPAGLHVYRAMSFRPDVTGFGPPSSSASTNIVVLPPSFIFSIEVQTVSISTGGSSNLATFNYRLPPVPGVQDVQLVRSKVSVTKQ